MEGFEIGQAVVVPRDRPNLTFEEGSYTLPELLESHLLPVVAQYDVTRQPVPFHEFNFDLTQPLLLYKKRNIQKVVARSLHIEDEKYIEVGESLLVPEDYKGWFAVLQRVTGNIRADDTVPHFTTVEEVASSNTDRFLIGGTKKISGLQLMDRSDTQLKHEQRYFLPGDILTREKIYYGETKKRTRLFRKPKYITEKFLMCRDECDREILLPFEQTGIFYQISHRSGKANKQVMQMSDIVARKLTPRIIKLVFGRFPVTPCSFTGIMRAESSKIETSIIASTLINTKNILMEIPVSSAMHFRVAVMNNDLRTNLCYRNAMSNCAERAITYMRNIKMCYNFTTEDDEDALSRGHFDSTDIQTQSMTNFMNNNNNIPLLTTFKQNSKSKTAILENFDTNNSILRKQPLLDEKHCGRRGFSVDIPDDVTVRPGRCLSTGRVSFCLGNNYLTVPMFSQGHFAKRESGNNNTIHEMIYTTKRGSRLSFNGTFFEEIKEECEPENNSIEKGQTVDIPPPLPCTHISSYVNVVKPPTIDEDVEDPDYIPASGSRRPSTQPPDTAPPPLPRSSSTSGVSSGSQSSLNDETASKRGSSDSFEYAVPKSQSHSKEVSNIPEMASVSSKVAEEQKPLRRRPSTFTFSEGCLGNQGFNSKMPINESFCDIEETPSDDVCPIYENIQKLMELVSKMETDDRNTGTNDCLENDVDDDLPNQKDDTGETTLTDDLDSVENVIIETKNEDLNLCENSGGNICDEKYVGLHGHLCEDKKDCNIDEIDTQSNSNENIINVKTRRIGVTERDIDVEKLEHNTDTEEVISKSSENDSSSFENEHNDETEQIMKTDKTAATEDNFEDTPNREIEISAQQARERFENNIPENESETESHFQWRIAVEKIKNSNELILSRGKIRTPEKPIRCLGVVEIAEELSSIGIKDETIEHMKEIGIDGAKLSEVIDGDLSIRDCLVGVNLVDQQKISMFLRGWRPNSE